MRQAPDKIKRMGAGWPAGLWLTGLFLALLLILPGCRWGKPGPELLNAQAREAAQTGRLEEAVRLLQDSLAQNPQQQPAQESLGSALYELGRYDASANAWKRALVLAPDSLTARTGLGLALLAQRQDQGAEKLFDQVLAKDPQAARALYGKSVVIWNSGNAPQARSLAEAALKNSPRMAEAHRMLGVILLEQGDLEGSLQHLKQASDLAPMDIATRYAMGRTLVAMKDYNQAAEAFRQALMRQPQDQDIRLELGRALYLGKQYEEAYIVLKDLAAAANPGAPAYFLAGLAAHKVGKDDEARTALHHFIEAEMGSPLGYHSLGIIAMDRGEFADAIPQFKAEIMLGQPLPDAYTLLAHAYAESGRLDQAISVMKQGRRAGMNEPRASLEEAWILFRAGSTAEAEAACRHILERFAASAYAHYVLGEMYRVSGRYPEAQEEYKLVAGLQSTEDPDLNTLAMYQVARCYARAGNGKEALLYLGQAGDQEPRFLDYATDEPDFTRLRRTEEFRALYR